MEMFYLAILAALFAALCQSLTDITTKLAVDYAHDEEILATQWVSGAIILIIFSLFSYPSFLIHPIDTSNALLRVDFFKLLLFSAIINIIAYSFYIIALRASQASLIIPLVLITPIFMLFTSPLMLGENTPPIGIIGVILILVGLGIFDKNFYKIDKNFFIVLKYPGAVAMLIAASLWSVTSNIDKLGLKNSSPLIWITALTTAISCGAILNWYARKRRQLSFWEMRYAILGGIFTAIGNLALVWAMSILFVPYVIAIKRISAFLTVVLSGRLLKEPVQNRLTACLVMLLGAILIMLARN